MAKSCLSSLGAQKKREELGSLLALPADFPPAKSASLSISLGEAREIRKSSLLEHRELPQLLLQDFWITSHVSPFTAGSHKQDMEKLPNRKPALSGFPSASGIALNYSGERGKISTQNFRDRILDDENYFFTQWKSFAPSHCTLLGLNRSH